ncbi:hypothetical protein D9M72_533030 [compost metagenome]
MLGPWVQLGQRLKDSQGALIVRPGLVEAGTGEARRHLHGAVCSRLDCGLGNVVPGPLPVPPHGPELRRSPEEQGADQGHSRGFEAHGCARHGGGRCIPVAEHQVGARQPGLGPEGDPHRAAAVFSGGRGLEVHQRRLGVVKAQRQPARAHLDALLLGVLGSMFEGPVVGGFRLRNPALRVQAQAVNGLRLNVGGGSRLR